MCDPRLCELAPRPHAHCPCGLPMARGETFCALCRLELLTPTGRSTEEWDGSSYPSRRVRRIACPSAEHYGEFLQVLLNGGEGDELPRRQRAPGRRAPRPVAPALTPEQAAATFEMAGALGGMDGQRALLRRAAAAGGRS